MAKVIHKYPIQIAGFQSVTVTGGSLWKPLKLDWQGNTLCIWALIDDELPMAPVEVLMTGTGHPIPDGPPKKYLDTIQQGPYVWHFFVEVNEK